MFLKRLAPQLDVNGIGIAAGVFAAYSLFRPVAFRLRTLPYERAMAKQILSEYGRSSLDFYKLWTDKAYFFSRDRRCFIAYRVASIHIAWGFIAPAELLKNWTVANLVPRARSHHAWYRGHFSDYPPERRALLPRLWQLGGNGRRVGYIVKHQGKPVPAQTI